ncbi:hypothetical protein DH2020_024254 [Rehmannia glutinosa]|uniref:Metallo-beta-lactamase domain-containing protein n=1 Tax=Rehmannia glutinosa TaxID=99300 RepID=A0ABR0WAU3_REHGL
MAATAVEVAENGNADPPRSSLVFLGTGCSSAVPNAMCLIQPSDPPCHVCSQSLALPPKQNPNYRCNTSLLIDYCGSEGNHKYILIDVGKTFREQVLRWFTFHKIPHVDSIILTHEHAGMLFLVWMLYALCNPLVQQMTLIQLPSTSPKMQRRVKFPYLVQKKLKPGQEIRRVAQLDWKIIENDFFHLQTLDAVKRICPKRALLIGMTHEFDHHKDNEFLKDWSNREGIPVQLAYDGLRISIDL